MSSISFIQTWVHFNKGHFVQAWLKMAQCFLRSWYYFTHWKSNNPCFEQIWIIDTQKCFLQSLVKIGLNKTTKQKKFTDGETEGQQTTGDLRNAHFEILAQVAWKKYA